MAVGVDRTVAKPSIINQGFYLHSGSEAMSNSLSTAPSVGYPAVTEHRHSSAPRPVECERPEHELEIQIHTGSPSLLDRKRRSSKTKEIRRSSSTPHMRNLAINNAGELSPTADKRRNKLGYHRISVACVHCRRRKIRCQVSIDDEKGPRCSNCLRLKKECIFQSVDQAHETQRPGSNLVKDVSIDPHTGSGTSPPHHIQSMPREGLEFRNPSYGIPTTLPQNPRFAVRTDVELDPQSPGVHMQHSPYGYPPPIETQWQTPGFLPSSTVAENSPSSATYWRPPHSASNSVYGSEVSVSGSQTSGPMQPTSTMSYGRVSENHAWSHPTFAPPTRSMSYGNIEDVPTHYANPAVPMQQQDYSRRNSPYPYPTIDTAPSLNTTSLGSNSGAPLSAPVMPNQPYGYPGWNTFSGAQQSGHEAQGRPASTQWNHEQARLDRVQEEHPPPILYSQHTVPPFYSGS